MPRKPIVAVSACVKDINGASFHAVHDKYLRAIARGANAIPVIVPATGDAIDPDVLIAAFDGFLFTGSPSDVEPHQYGGSSSREGSKHDPERDATTLPLLRALLEANRPVLAICRGFQELNVACGGTLHQHVHELSGMLDHRAPSRELPVEVRYAPEHHQVRIHADGVLAQLTAEANPMVNSLHRQGIERLGDGLSVEAVAPDGLIEAVRYTRARNAILGVQWHPEACIDYNAFARAIFAQFGEWLRR
jgi:putative glutamine amidotransferase